MSVEGALIAQEATTAYTDVVWGKINYIVLALAAVCACDSALADTVGQRGAGVARDLDARSGGAIYERSYALVIGIDNYPKMPEMPRLRSAVHDAKAVARALRKRGFEVITLYGRKATQKKIKRVLAKDLPNRLTIKDRVVIYFAGHGQSVGRGRKAIGYLLPSDAAEVEVDGIDMEWLTRIIRKRYAARHVMYLADACYSGLSIGTRSAAADPGMRGYIGHVTRERVRLTLTAGAAGEQVHEKQDHGVFTYHLLEALNGRGDTNSDGYLTSAELWLHLQRGVVETGQVEGFRQTPQFRREGEGEMIFTLGPRTKAKKRRRARSSRSRSKRARSRGRGARTGLLGRLNPKSMGGALIKGLKGKGRLESPGDTKNCGDFDRWVDAQQFFDRYYKRFGDVARLDQDKDQIACESLPGAPGK